MSLHSVPEESLTPSSPSGSAQAVNPRYAVLFDPVRIGPVIAPNRFYQVPHASGMTNALPHVRARFRETKAEGGWGVVCTGAVSIHPSKPPAATVTLRRSVDGYPRRLHGQSTPPRDG